MSQRLLLVEDDASNAHLFRLMCEGGGYEVLHVANGERALEVLRTESVDLVLMDLQMPGLDGLSATRAIKQHPSTARLPVVIATAWANPEATGALLSAGAVAVLIKPFTRQELLACLRDVLS